MQTCRQVTVCVLVGVCRWEASKRAGKRMGMLAGMRCTGGAGGTYENLEVAKVYVSALGAGTTQAPSHKHRYMCSTQHKSAYKDNQ